MPYGEPEIDVDNQELDGEGNLSVDLTMFLTCNNCSTQLKSNSFEIVAQVDHTCDKPLPEGSEHFEIMDVETDPIERMETKNPKTGKQIKARYAKTYYGASVTVSITCTCCGENFEYQEDVEEQASGFQEMV